MQKAKKVHEAMAWEKETHEWALKILRSFFTKDEVKTCNVSGTNDKKALKVH